MSQEIFIEIFTLYLSTLGLSLSLSLILWTILSGLGIISFRGVK